MTMSMLMTRCVTDDNVNVSVKTCQMTMSMLMTRCVTDDNVNVNVKVSVQRAE